MHPSRRGVWERVDDTWARLLTGVEVWNRKYDGIGPSRDGLTLHSRYPSLSPIVGLDFHSARQFFPLGLRVEGDMTHGSVHESLRTGRFEIRALGTRAELFEDGVALHSVRAAEAVRRRLARSVRAAGRSVARRRSRS